jgi:pimeloyl-ACP methyl ester carboxylesterase
MNGRGRKDILYFHGFASSPHSRKVTRLRDLLEPDGFVFDTPDLNVPSFEALDFDAMIDLGVARGRATPPSAIVGSSLGSLVALEVARQGIDAPLVLIAPPLGMASRWITILPAGDPISVFNHARNADAPIHRAFFERMARVDVDRHPPSQPVAVIIGRHDETVPFDGVLERWREWEGSGRLAKGSQFVEIPNGDHGLVEFTDAIARVIARLAASPSAARSRAESR